VLPTTVPSVGLAGARSSADLRQAPGGKLVNQRAVLQESEEYLHRLLDTYDAATGGHRERFGPLMAHIDNLTKSAETPDLQGLPNIGAPRFELGTSSPPD